jgi:hypothetical protein
MSEELKIRFQLKATLRNGESVRLPSSSGNGRLSFLESYSANENRPKILSFAVVFQSTRTSP